tara:strand:+ start:25043 stop:25189 length:147 start_codon:yes stop_codon:yes gene_type:complete
LRSKLSQSTQKSIALADASLICLLIPMDSLINVYKKSHLEAELLSDGG